MNRKEGERKSDGIKVQTVKILPIDWFWNTADPLDIVE